MIINSKMAPLIIEIIKIIKNKLCSLSHCLIKKTSLDKELVTFHAFLVLSKSNKILKPTTTYICMKTAPEPVFPLSLQLLTLQCVLLTYKDP